MRQIRYDDPHKSRPVRRVVGGKVIENSNESAGKAQVNFAEPKKNVAKGGKAKKQQDASAPPLFSPAFARTPPSNGNQANEQWLMEYPIPLSALSYLLSSLPVFDKNRHLSAPEWKRQLQEEFDKPYL